MDERLELSQTKSKNSTDNVTNVTAVKQKQEKHLKY